MICVSVMDQTLFKRMQVANYWMENGKPSYRHVARKLGVSVSYVRKWCMRSHATNAVNRKPRTDPNAAVRARMVARAVQLVQQPDYRSCARVAAAISSEFDKKVSATTVRRWLKAQDMVYAPPKFQPLTTKKHLAARLSWAQDNLDRDWDDTLMTDSKYFFMHPPRKGHFLRAWGKKGSRRVVHTVKHSQKVHMLSLIHI